MLGMFSSPLWFSNYRTISIGGDLIETEKQSQITVGNAEGYECISCQEFCPMATLNQPDGAKEFTCFRCYSCRKGLSTIFIKIQEK